MRRKPEILDCFLASLRHLDHEGHQVDHYFVDDNTDAESQDMLRAWRPARGATTVAVPVGLPEVSYDAADDFHRWDWLLARRLAVVRNHLIEQALTGGYDAWVSVDSDLCLQPDTLHWLLRGLRLGHAEVVVEVFWTRFFRSSKWYAPNVWLWGECNLFRAYPNEVEVTPEERDRRTRDWFRELHKPGLHRIGGGGACMIASRKALEAGCHYGPVENLGWWGEDRFFQVRAAVAGIQLWADTHCPPLHLYRSSDLARWPEWRDRHLGRAAAVDVIAV